MRNYFFLFLLLCICLSCKTENKNNALETLVLRRKALVTEQLSAIIQHIEARDSIDWEKEWTTLNGFIKESQDSIQAFEKLRPEADSFKVASLRLFAFYEAVSADFLPQFAAVLSKPDDAIKKAEFDSLAVAQTSLDSLGAAHGSQFRKALETFRKAQASRK